jgi:polyhydroxyalkanoate synthase
MTVEQDGPDADVATGLDMLLTDGALGPLRRMLPAAAGVRFALSLAARPVTVTRRGAGLAAELTKIGIGASEVAPHPKDKRYAHPAWADNPVLRRLVQTHIAAGGTVADLVADADLDWPTTNASGSPSATSSTRWPPATACSTRWCGAPRGRPVVPASCAVPGGW